MNATPERTTFLGCPLDLVGREEILARAEAAASGEGPRLRIEGLNVAKLVEARESPALMAALHEAELVHADGNGVVFGLVMAMCVIAAALALGKIKRADPADLF